MIKLGIDKVKFMLGDKKVKYIYRGSTKVYSSGSIVSYYDGNTLLGTEEIEEGLDVLHPDIDTSKANYTLIGWGTSTDLSSMVLTMNATGEPITLYALYMPNELTVAIGALTNNAGWTTYGVSVQNSRYVSGALGCTAQRSGYIAGGGSVSASATFSIDLGLYGLATIVWDCATGNGDVQWFTFDGVNLERGTKQVTVSGSHSMSTGGSTPSNSWTSTSIGITRITLSNPTPWE